MSKIFFIFMDVLISPLVFLSSILLWLVRRVGVSRLIISRRIFSFVGLFPIRNHYYEPQFTDIDPGKLDQRVLPGINFCIDEQLELISHLTYANEIIGWPKSASDAGGYYLNNKNFASGDAEFLYQMIRHYKPGRLIEIGSGYSTLIAVQAIQKNKEEDSNYSCRHCCIEPYEMPWLEKTGVEVIRKKVESLNIEFFSQLSVNDILFIDSSHIIRPQGDVLYEYLELLPKLKPGVIVHIHDIFTPRNYLKSWLIDDVKFWNEQYLLEAFLTENKSWQVLAGLNLLHHQYPEKLKEVCPHLSPEREPGSFYIKKTG